MGIPDPLADPVCNPWADLPAIEPFVLPCDRLTVEAHNTIAAPAERLDLRLMPEPFMGRPDAPIVLLALNPGLSSRDLRAHRRPEFQARVRSCLAHGSDQYPFYYLDPSQRGPGVDWWRRVAGSLVEQFGAEAVADRMLCVEYLPYHSVKFDHAHLRLPSQEYGFALVREAIRRKAEVVVMRGLRYWLGAVPELAGYPLRSGLRNVRNTTLSAGNLDGAYERVFGVLAASYRGAHGAS
jgi:hypothetical protein